jgi:hypothetical protein
VVDEAAVAEAQRAHQLAEAKLAEARRQAVDVARVARQHENLLRVNDFAAVIAKALRRSAP